MQSTMCERLEGTNERNLATLKREGEVTAQLYINKCTTTTHYYGKIDTRRTKPT